VHNRRLPVLVLVIAVAAGSVTLGACSGGAKAGNGATNPPSTSGS